MKIIKRDNRKIWETKTTKGYEYPFNIKNLDFAVVEIKGKYPTDNWCRNTLLDAIFYVKKGKGRIIFKDKIYDLNEDDAIFVERNEWYYWDSTTNATIIEMYNSQWTFAQVENKDNI